MNWPDDFENKIICGDNLAIMPQIPDGSIDLTVTSPPYDNLRDYHGYTFDFKSIANQLYRVTKDGGVVVWVVGDATINGSETGTSFRQALGFMDIGFNLHDTMIYKKPGVGACGSIYAYWQAFEYMFVLSKGKPNAINRIKDRVNTTAGTTRGRNAKQDLLKTRTNRPNIVVGKLGIRDNVWEYQTGMMNKDNITSHPAIFPDQLAADHIYSWSNEGDIVLDPMCGSGTTCTAAIKLGRRFFGCDISQEYCDIANERIRAELAQPDMFIKQPAMIGIGGE